MPPKIALPAGVFIIRYDIDVLYNIIIYFAGFEETRGADGKLKIRCKSCSAMARAMGKGDKYLTKSYLPSHTTTTEHLRAVTQMRSDSLHHQEMQAESSKEAVPIQALNVERLPAVQKAPQRPQIPMHEEVYSDDFQYFDDVVFSAGQEVIDRYENRHQKTWAHDYALDKYGNEADEIDITVNSVTEELTRKRIQN